MENEKTLYLKNYFNTKIISEDDGYKFYNLLNPLIEDNNIDKIFIDFDGIELFVCAFIHNSISKLVLEKGLDILGKIYIKNLDNIDKNIIIDSISIAINMRGKQ